MSWREFWNGTHSIYVSGRHRTLHYEGIARDIVALLPLGSAIVLDHGCGDALSADIVAAACGRLYLFDAAANVQERLRQRFAGNAKIGVLSNAALDALPDGSLDLVVVNSLLQYLGRADFETLLDFWHRLLKPTGKLVIADVIAPDSGALGDVTALLSFAWRGGFFVKACTGLVATYFSDYRKLRHDLGLTRYSADEMQRLLAAHGFVGARAETNIGHNQKRMMFVAAPR
jgi:ubiquinone/menaquinone biosynthesis C-methylase UbiE